MKVHLVDVSDVSTILHAFLRQKFAMGKSIVETEVTKLHAKITSTTKATKTTSGNEVVT